MSSKYGNIANMLGVELNEVFEVKKWQENLMPPYNVILQKPV